MTFWSTQSVECPFPRDEDPTATAWWDGMMPHWQERWAPLLRRLDKRGRAHFQSLRRSVRDEFKTTAGTPERAAEEDAAEERLHRRVSEGVAKRQNAEVRP